MRYPHTIKIPEATGAIYNHRCRWQDIAFGQKIQVSGDQSVDADGHVFFPTNVSGLEPDLTFLLTLESESQTGKIVHVERVGKPRTAIGKLLDKAQSTTLGTITDLQVFDNGSGSVVLTFTAAPGATSHQAQVDGVDEGSSVDGTTEIITLSGLTSGQKAFTVDASDGTDTTTSNSVTFTVS